MKENDNEMNSKLVYIVTKDMMKEKSIKLNSQVRDLITNEMFNNLVNILLAAPYHTICLDDDKKDKIYGYTYHDGIVDEYQVKGIQLSADEKDIYVYLDLSDIVFTLDDLLEIDDTDDEGWYPIFSGELLGWLTMININENIHEYI